MAKLTFQEYIDAIDRWAAEQRPNHFYRPGRLRVGHLRISAGQYSFTVLWKGVELLSGKIPRNDSLQPSRCSNRVDYVCELVKAALGRVDVVEMTLL